MASQNRNSSKKQQWNLQRAIPPAAPNLISTQQAEAALNTMKDTAQSPRKEIERYQEFKPFDDSHMNKDDRPILTTVPEGGGIEFLLTKTNLTYGEFHKSIMN